MNIIKSLSSNIKIVQAKNQLFDIEYKTRPF